MLEAGTIAMSALFPLSFASTSRRTSRWKSLAIVDLRRHQHTGPARLELLFRGKLGLVPGGISDRRQRVAIGPGLRKLVHQSELRLLFTIRFIAPSTRAFTAGRCLSRAGR